MSYPSANPSLLYTASQKCVEHRNKHVENNISPHDCKRNMASLKRVVNKIEQTEAQSWSCSPSELCFFYRSILTCSFCPHAMTIFEEGSLSDILPRVSLLLSTTMSPTVHSPSENLETICSTIATFLGKLSSPICRRLAFSDLTSMLSYLLETEASSPPPTFPLEFPVFPSTSLYIRRDEFAPPATSPPTPPPTPPLPISLQSPLHLYLLRKALFEIISIVLSPSSEPSPVSASLSTDNHRCLSNIIAQLLSFPPLPPPSSSSDPSDHTIYEANLTVRNSCLSLLVHVMPSHSEIYGPLIPLVVQTLHIYVSDLTAGTQHLTLPLIDLVRLIPVYAPKDPRVPRTSTVDEVVALLISSAAILNDNHQFMRRSNSMASSLKTLVRTILGSVYQLIALDKHGDPGRVRPISDATVASICALTYPGMWKICSGEACAVLASIFDENIDIGELTAMSPSPSKRRRLDFSQSPSSPSAHSRVVPSNPLPPNFSSLGRLFTTALQHAAKLSEALPRATSDEKEVSFLTNSPGDQDTTPYKEKLIYVATATRILTIIDWSGKCSRQISKFVKDSLGDLLDAIHHVVMFINVSLKQSPPDYTKEKPFGAKRMKEIFTSLNFALTQIIFCHGRNPFPSSLHPLHPNSRQIKSICTHMFEIFSSTPNKDFVAHCGLNHTFDNFNTQFGSPLTLNRYSSISSSGTNATTSPTQTLPPQTQLVLSHTQSPSRTELAQISHGVTFFCDKTCKRMKELFSIPIALDTNCSCKVMKGDPIMGTLNLERCLRNHPSVLFLYISAYSPPSSYEGMITLKLNDPEYLAYRAIPSLIFSHGGLKVLPKLKVYPSIKNNLAFIAANLVGLRGRILGTYGVDDDSPSSSILPLPHLSEKWTNPADPAFSFEILSQLGSCGLLAKVVSSDENSLKEYPRLRLIIIKTVVAALQSALQNSELCETLLPKFLYPPRAEIFKSYFPAIAEYKTRGQIASCKPPRIVTAILYLLCAPFAEDEGPIRDYLQGAIPPLLATNGGILLSHLFAPYDDDYEETLHSPRRKSSKRAKTRDSGASSLPKTSRPGTPEPREVITFFYRLYDFLLAKYSPLACPDVTYGASLLSNTASASVQTTGASMTSTLTSTPNNPDITTSKLSALAVLGSLCISSGPLDRTSSKILPILFESSFMHILKFWLEEDLEIYSFKTIMTVHQSINFTELFSAKRLPDNCSLFVLVVRELLLAFEGDTENQFFFLHAFLEEFIYKPLSFSLQDKVKYLNNATMHLYPGFVVEEDAPCMKRWSKYVYRLSRVENSTGESMEIFHLILVKKNIQYITAKVLLLFERGPIVFLLRNVLNDSHTLQSIMKTHARIILKILLESLGQIEKQQDVLKKIKWSAIWYNMAHRKSSKGNRENTSQQSNASSIRPLESVDMMINMTNNPDGSSNVDVASRPTVSNDEQEEAARLWVKPHIMFLLHNFMLGYKNKDTEQKTRTMCCINGIIRFLVPSEAARYMPKILSSVNIGLSDGSNDPKLRFYALKNLVSFVKVLCQEPLIKTNVDLVGQNLTSIVVALLPVFSHFEVPSESASSKAYKKDSMSEAVSLFQYLISGQLGNLLSGFLSNLPFLPNHSQFEPVKESLRSELNIDLDDLSNYNKMHEGDEEVVDHQVRGLDGKYQVVLQRRLKNLGSLISHENLNVRKTVLNQLAALINENKRLFKKLVDSEESASTRFLTKRTGKPKETNGDELNTSSKSPTPSTQNNVGVVPDSVRSGGGVSTLIQTLLDRCAKETNEGVKLALAVTLGEIGAIDPNKLSMEKFNNPDEDDVSADDDNDLRWRLSQAPWNSTMNSYSMKLVSNRLVVALKAALTTQDQDKVGFAIQETLKLLNDIQSRPSSQSANPPSEMKPELKKKLENFEVMHIVEPFLNTQFKQQNIKHVSRPPFFQKDKPYQRWISSWSRFLINKSCQNELSKWKSMFQAVSSAVRADVGLSVAEFLLPLLILDVACFGDDTDLSAIIKEIKLVFDVSSLSNNKDDLWSDFCSDDHRRAVNTVFMVLETLEFWTEREIEQRYLKKEKDSNSHRRSQPSSAGSSAAGDKCWPVDDCIERIQNISSQINLQMRADAAIKVGAHARAVKYLELGARKNVVDVVFNAEGEQEKDRELSKDDRLGNTLAPVPPENIGKMQVLLGKLDDVDGMCSLSMHNASSFDSSLVEQIFQKEVVGDWAGALQGYEQAIILHEAEAGMNAENETNGMDVDDEDSDFTTDHVDGLGEDGEGKWSKQQLEKGLLRSLLHLGQLESVLNQVGGMMNRRVEENELEALGENREDYSVKEYLPNAVEAAWRLQKWPLLADLLEKQDMIEKEAATKVLKSSAQLPLVRKLGGDPESKFQIGVGRAMLALHEKKKEKVKNALNKTRIGLMGDMSNAARESYSRSLNLLVKFHCLQEIEQSTEILCRKDKRNFFESSKSCSANGWDWDGRLSNLGRLDSSSVITVRLSLAKLGNAKALEGDLWLTTAKKARKSNKFHIAEPALSHSLAAYKIAGVEWKQFESKVRLQIAKVKQNQNKTSDALMIIEPKIVDRLLSAGRKSDIISYVECDGKAHYGGSVDQFVDMALCATRWTVESNLKFGSEIMTRFNNIVNLENREKSQFYLARYLDGLVEKRIASMIAGDFDSKEASFKLLAEELDKCSSDEDKRTQVLKHDEDCFKNISYAIKAYASALQLGDKHLYQALPRMLTMWFEFTGLPVNFEDKVEDLDGRSRGKKAVSYSKKRGKDYDEPKYKTNADAQLDRKIREMNNRVHHSNGKKPALFHSIPQHVFYSALPQLVSRIAHPRQETQTCTVHILKRVLAKYPHQAMWGLAWLRHSHSVTRKSHGEDIFKWAARELKKSDPASNNHKLLDESVNLFKFLKSIADNDRATTNPYELPSFRFKSNVALQDFVPPVQAALSLSVARSMSRSEADKRRKGVIAEVFPQYVPRMRSFGKYGKVFPSKAKPKSITAHAVGMKREGRNSAGNIGEIQFLVKKETKGDLRKDTRVQDFNNVLNRLLAGGGKRGENTGILEWVPNTNSLRDVIKNCVNHQADADNAKRRGARACNFQKRFLRETFAHCQNLYIDHGKLSKAAVEFERLMLKPYPPVLYWWFVQKFQEPHDWYDARRRFTLSAAVWSAVGHILGLGDRHTENILVDTSNGECVHVDFDCLFDKALKLARPEVVPFRLTSNMVDAMGSVGYEGAFRGGLIETLTVLRENRELLLAILQPFLLDPVISWKRGTARIDIDDGTGLEMENSEARVKMGVLDGRLRGIYNLVNPNFKRIKRVDQGGNNVADDESAAILPLGVEGQAHKLICEATSSENLVQMYVGWMSWL